MSELLVLCALFGVYVGGWWSCDRYNRRKSVVEARARRQAHLSRMWQRPSTSEKEKKQ